MATTFEMADAATVALMERAMEIYHAELKRYEVKIGVIMAFGEEDKEGEIKRPIMNQGVPCAAKVKIVSLKDRLTKGTDVEILLDGTMWQELDDDRKLAIFDHELEHLKLKINADGELERDSLKRPKIRTVFDSIGFWGFASIAERHGINSQEYLCFQALRLKYGHLLDPKKEIVNA
jgi:predicted transport protein